MTLKTTQHSIIYSYIKKINNVKTNKFENKIEMCTKMKLKTINYTLQTNTFKYNTVKQNKT